MSEKPEDHFAVGEPRTLETRRLGAPQADDAPSPRLRRMIFWAVVAVVVLVGVVLYFLSAESVAPVLRSGS